MTGTRLLALVLISMGWLFFLGGLVLNYRGRPGIPVLPGVVGSVTVFFSLSAFAVDVPWPWFWILLPLVIDPLCVLGLLRRLRK